MKKWYYVVIAFLCLIIGVSIVVIIRIVNKGNVVAYNPIEEVTVVEEYEEPAVTEDRANKEDRHDDEAYITKHESYVSTGANHWEPPVDWELPDEVYDTVDQSVLYLYGSMDYTECVKLQYAMYMYFGEDLSGLRHLSDSTAPGPEGVNLYWVLTDKDNNMYAIWMDYYNGFIKPIVE